MLRAVDALLQDLEDRGQVATHEGGGIEPEARKHLALRNSVRVRHQSLKLTLTPHEPIDRTIINSPDNVFENTVAAVNVKLRIQIEAGAACRHFASKFGSAFQVIILADLSLAAEFRFDEHDGVWLGLVIHVETNRTIIAHQNSDRECAVLT